MHDGALRRVAELPQDMKLAMESILGRALLEDEVVAINIYKPALTGDAREDASKRLLNRVDRTAAKARGVPDQEIDAAIDEAADHVRHRPE